MSLTAALASLTSLAPLAAANKPFSWFFEQCDTFGKAIAVLLFGCSIVSIATMIHKYFELASWRKRNLSFSRKLDRVDSVLALKVLRAGDDLCPCECLAAEVGKAFEKHRGKGFSEADITLCVGHVENAIQRGLAAQLVRYERRLVWLTSLVSGGPFLGLLGTVYGVMIAFGGLSDKATISQLAPGVAGALVTTTCGLLVAIPATFGFNYLITQSKLMTAELENFASSLADRIELELRELFSQNAAAEPPPAPVSDFSQNF
jgi:biopolymer transport protein TolQ